MFKTAATKIAHNSTLPSLGGNSDLRPLQDLITAEKAVLISLQKLSVDYSKASEALRTWGLNEGDDLGDILSASTTILNHFSSALSQYASHGHVMREHLKAIRTREEALEDLKRRRRNVHRKAEDAEKKLSKMSPEHKNLQLQTETLNRLRDEMRTMDSDIMLEEAGLGDFKRTATRMFMGLKFGGLQECCEKGTIVADFGKRIISEISEEMTQPGLPRTLYYGHSRTEQLVAETYRAVNDVVLSTVPTVGFRDRRHYDGTLPDVRDQPSLPSIPQDLPPPGPQSAFQFTAPAESQSTLGPGSSPSSGPWSLSDSKPQPFLPPVDTDFPSNGKPFESQGSAVPPPTGGSSFMNQPLSPQQSQGPQLGSNFPQSPSRLPQISGLPPQTVDDFGVNINSRSEGPIDTSNTSGGRFATFPVKNRAPGSSGGYSLSDPARHEQEQSFAASIAEALDDRMSQETGGATEGTDRHRMTPWGASRNANAQAPLPPPPGAALPDMSNPWSSSNATRDAALQPPTGHSKTNIQRLSSNDDALLAYMTMGSLDEDDDQTQEAHALNRSGGSQFLPQPQAQAPVSGQPQPLSQAQPQPQQLGIPPDEEEQHRVSRHVHFGEVEDVDEEMEKRESLEKERQARDAMGGDKSRFSESPSPESQVEDKQDQGPVDSSKASEHISPPSSGSGSSDRSRRVPPPVFEPEEDERSLNAAAAREVSKELEALKLSSPISPVDAGQRAQNEQPLSTVERGRQPAMTLGGATGYNEQGRNGRDLSPLPPPSAPFANRSVSPHPYAELNPNSAQPPSYGSPYNNNNASTQSYQQGSYNSSPYGSPAQTYTQPSYDPQIQAPIPMSSSSSLPPRFQALQQQQALENPIPPRFQAAARDQSPGSPIRNALPPRFQAGDSPKIPAPALNIPERSPSPAEQGGGRLQALKAAAAADASPGLGSPGGTPFRTPPEYPIPRQLGATSPWNNSSSSLNLKSVSPAPGARTISAAAFKRPRNTSSDTLPGGDPMKKTLPSSPYPRRGTNASETSAPAPAPIAAPAPAPAARPLSTLADGEDDHYDYISAYVNNSNPNSPSRGEFAQTTGGGGGSGGGGYGEGRFATDLDSGLR